MADENSAPATGAPQHSAPAPGTQENRSANLEDALRDGGKRALDEERRARREAELRLKELEPLAAKARALEDASKSELQKLADKLKDAESTGTGHAMAALRLDVALEKAPDGMSPAKIRSLAKRLSGSTREELEADAAELFAEFAGKPVEEKQQNGKNVRPTPNLRRQVPVPGGGDREDTNASMNDWLRASARK